MDSMAHFDGIICFIEIFPLEIIDLVSPQAGGQLCVKEASSGIILLGWPLRTDSVVRPSAPL